MPDFNFDDINPLIDHTAKKEPPKEETTPDFLFAGNKTEPENNGFQFPNMFAEEPQFPPVTPAPVKPVQPKPAAPKVVSQRPVAPKAVPQRPVQPPVQKMEPKVEKPKEDDIWFPESFGEPPKVSAEAPTRQFFEEPVRQEPVEEIKPIFKEPEERPLFKDPEPVMNNVSDTFKVVNLDKPTGVDDLDLTPLEQPDILDKFDPVKVAKVDERLSQLIESGNIDDIPKLKEAFDKLRLPYEAILSKKLSKTGDSALNSEGICDSANAILIGGMELSL